MKPTTTSVKKMLFVKFLLLTLLNCSYLFAQEPITITYEGAVQCMEFSNVEERLKYAELVEQYGECRRVCENNTVTYSLAGGTGTVTSTQWLVTGGTIDSSTPTECTITWGPAGFAVLSAVVETTNGQVTIPEMCIQLIVSPVANFTIPPMTGSLRGCVNQDLYFDNTSIDNDGSDLYSYYWEFGDGNVSSEFEPVHSYDQPGTYEITLTVRNLCNCISKIRKRIRIGAETFPIECPSVVCEGEIATYSVGAIGKERCRDFNWNVQGGHIVSDPNDYTIQVLWDHVDNSGFGYVSFSTSGCEVECPGVTTIRVPVIKNRGRIVGETEVCARSQYKYSLPQWPATLFNWVIEDDGGTGATLVLIDQRNEVAINTQSNGVIVLRCNYQNTVANCSGTAVLKITVKPSSAIVGVEEMCPDTNNTYYLDSGLSGDWVLVTPDGPEPVHNGPDYTFNFEEPGNYTLSVTGEDFCAPDPMMITVYANPPAPGAIEPDPAIPVCPNTPLTYTVPPAPPGHTVHWDVIGGVIEGSTTGEEVTIVFNPSLTSYQIKTWITRTTDPHCTSPVNTTTINRIVFSPVITGPVDVCANNYATFNTAYTGGDDYQWTILTPNKGSVSSGNGTPQVEILWNNTSVNTTAQIKLVVTKCGIVETRYFNVNILTAPSITLNGPTQLCRDQFGNWNVSSSMAITSGSITWDFGDGTVNTYTITPSTPNLSKSHDYNTVNTGSLSYTVTVTLTGVNGCDGTVSASKNVTVLPAPVAQMTPDINRTFCNASEIDVEFEVAVQAGSTIGTYHIEWYRGGTHLTAEDDNTSILAVNYGFGTYRARIINGNGCSIWTNQMTISQNCPQPGCSPQPSLGITWDNDCGTITATGTATGVTVTSAFWVAGSLTPTTTNSNPAVFTTENAGNYDLVYNVNYTVGGQTCSAMKNVTVTVPYIAGINYSVDCGSSPGQYSVTLFNTTNFMTSHQPTSIQYYNGGSLIPSGTGLNEVTVQLPPGTYTFKIIVNEAGGEPCEAEVSVVLPAMPNSTINPPTQTVCFNTPAIFTPAGAIDPESSYFWTFGDGTENRNPNASRVYQTAGSRTVTLTVTNKYGCQSTSTATATTLPDSITGSVNASAEEVCAGNSITFTYSGTAVTGYAWKKDGAFIPGANASSYVATANGSYTVQVTDSNGCKKTMEPKNAKFLPLPVPTITGPSHICGNEELHLEGGPAPDGTNIIYNWFMNGYNVGSGFSPDLYITPGGSGIYNFTLTVVQNNDGTSCSASVTHIVEVYEAPEKPEIHVTMENCDTYALTLHATSPSSGTYTWSNGMSGEVITVFEGGPYMVTLTNAAGCMSSHQVYVPKNPDSYLWVFPTGCYDFCKELDVATLIGPLPDFRYWEWQESGNAIQSGHDSPVTPYTVSGSGSYSLHLDNGMCSATSDIMDVSQESCKCKIRYEVKKIGVKKEGYCYYTVDMYIDNPNGTPMSVTVSLDQGMGVVQPSTVVVPPGGATFSFNVIPIYMTGGIYTIYLDSNVNDKGEKCYNEFEVEFPPLCEQSQSARIAQGDTGIAVSSLMVVPNPVEDVADLHYTYTTGKNAKIEIYNLLGVLLESYVPDVISGAWKLDMGKYAAGQYIVVMKQDGEVIQQKHLVKK
ncbi:PKD domain-containing protein [Flavobacterium sp. MFBS3-15]|uniref:PKD domain-containing protein n=1 Tax=Flavobacterium sp. MFBS3-15 TaxID=2989816 RepID=UPI002235DD03|nr:PKD domain-containing protein [Flavobacterium sp. MFBS3-15]MCW4469939.1 PKD domain-containing protein [Flavobacterium sp. MFBS3-15]